MMKKRLLALLLATVCILMFSGCSTNGISLFSAWEKELEITSVKTTEVLSGNMKITLPTEVQEEMDVNLQSILNMLSSFRMEGTTLQQYGKTSVTEKMNFSVISDDICFDTEAYATIGDSQYLMVIKIPTPAKALLPQRYENATYFTIDSADSQTLVTKQDELERLQAQFFGYEYTPEEVVAPEFPYKHNESMQLSKKWLTAMKNYAMLMEDAPEVISKAGNTYSLKLTDASFKELLRSMVLTYFDNPQARKIVADMMEEAATYYQNSSGDEIAAALSEMPQFPENDPMLAANLKAQAELILNMLQPVRLIGEDGIRIDYTVNSSGYITELNADLHLDFDINALTELLEGEAEYEEEYAFEMRLHYNQKRQNINGIHKIQFPTLSQENNLPFFRMMTDSVQEEIDRLQYRIDNGEFFTGDWEEDFTLPAPDGSISVVVDYGGWRELMDFEEHKPFITEDGVLYVPVDNLLWAWDSASDYNPDNGYVLFIHPYTQDWLWFHPGSKTICSDYYEINLPQTTLDIDGVAYVPLRSFTSAFTDYKITWDADENAAYLIPWYMFE